MPEQHDDEDVNDYDDEYDDEHEWLKTFSVGAVIGAWVGALVIGMTWWGVSWRTDPQPPRAAVASGQGSDRGTAQSSDPSGQTSHLSRCRSVHDTQSAPLKAASASISLWEVHIGAMNKLVTGAISLEEAQQFWDQTRTGAHAKLRAFATARRPYDERIYACPPPTRAAATQRELGQCHRAVAVRGRTLRLATKSLERWEQHVHHMEMLRDGKLTPERATGLWMRDWVEGDREVRVYRAAARRAHSGPTC